jgi:hypothetical protein
VPFEPEAGTHQRKSSYGEPSTSNASKLMDKRGIRNQSPQGEVSKGLINNEITRKISTANDDGKLPLISKTPVSNGSSKLQHQSTKHETQLLPPNSFKKTEEGGQEEEEYDEEYEYEDDELVKPNKDALMYEDAINNLQNIKKNEREELSKLEEENEILRTINDKSKILEYNKNAQA